MNKVSITIGGLAPPMSEQLPGISALGAASLQRMHDAIVLLKVTGIMSRYEVDKAARRLAERAARYMDDDCDDD